MVRIRSWTGWALAGMVVAGSAACSSSMRPDAPDEVVEVVGTPRFLSCPYNQTPPRPDTRRIGAGGTGNRPLQAGPHSLGIPRNAVGRDIDFTFSEPARDIVGITIEAANNQTVWFGSGNAATLTINLQRCRPPNDTTTWYIWRMRADGTGERLRTERTGNGNILSARINRTSAFMIAN
jgi:hypothetical protein